MAERIGNLPVGNPCKRIDDFNRLFGFHRIINGGCLFLSAGRSGGGGRYVARACAADVCGHILIEKVCVNAEQAEKIVKAAAGNAVGAGFVFLHLLKSETKPVGKLLLSPAERLAAEPETAADVFVNAVWFAVIFFAARNQPRAGRPLLFFWHEPYPFCCKANFPKNSGRKF